METYKMALCGDSGVGKTCLLITHATNEFPYEYIPTVCENYTTSALLGGKQVNFDMWDSSGRDGHEMDRQASLRDANVVLICFAVDSLVSFQNVTGKWHQEVSLHAPGAAIILVGMKADRREEISKEGYVTLEMADKVKKELGAYAYVECSSLSNTKEGHKTVLDEAVRSVRSQHDKRKKGKCAVM